MAKKSYTVSGFVAVPVSFHVEVEATSKKAAEELHEKVAAEITEVD